MHRRTATLLTVWGAALAILGMLVWFSRQAPAFADVLAPFEIGLIGVAIYLSARWMRTRQKGLDRRHADRRHTERRDGE
ncbi:MAG TPA: hypothetical protein VHM67_11535 [Gemmatimonadaceae bacterium]|nr:hypothetical protein [Gemmatimonadaceae bacterium]